MSTLKLENIQHPSSSTPAISLDSNGGMTGSFPSPNRNLIYNGAMQVHQRGTSVSGNSTGGYLTADRWLMGMSSMGAWTQTVENDAPTGSGFRKSLKMLCTTADAAPAADDFVFLLQRLEGQDLQRIAKGTSSAQPLVLSFWVKSNVTGTYVVNLEDYDNGRLVSASYTINASGVWEKKSISLPADTTGAFDNDNAMSLGVDFWLGSGSNRTSGTLRTSWTTTATADFAVGQTNLAAATNNYWQVTGVQLEVGDTATEFEHEPYGTTLAKCQRYYQNFTITQTTYPGDGNAYPMEFPLISTMRTTPDVSSSTIITNVNNTSGWPKIFATANTVTIEVARNAVGVVKAVINAKLNAEL